LSAKLEKFEVDENLRIYTHNVHVFKLRIFRITEFSLKKMKKITGSRRQFNRRKSEKKL
jgi:hypothetical protein